MKYSNCLRPYRSRDCIDMDGDKYGTMDSYCYLGDVVNMWEGRMQYSVTVRKICLLQKRCSELPSFLMSKVPSLSKMSEWKGVHRRHQKLLRYETWAMRTDRLKPQSHRIVRFG